jgi:hypothetical protein
VGVAIVSLVLAACFFNAPEEAVPLDAKAPPRWIHSTANFRIGAPTREIAVEVGEAAERHRERLARQWLGKPLPRWPEPCPVEVTITTAGASSASAFLFDEGRILSQKVEVEGAVEEILASALLCAVTHLVLAHHFAAPVPRWADEGAAVLADSAGVRHRYEDRAREVLRDQKRAIPLGRLFTLADYPHDVSAFFAESASITRFLVGAKGRKAFLAFVKDGRGGNWDAAVRTHYGYPNVAALEQAWRKSLPVEPARAP